jgi:hypothetical protein
VDCPAFRNIFPVKIADIHETINLNREKFLAKLEMIKVHRGSMCYSKYYDSEEVKVKSILP